MLFRDNPFSSGSPPTRKSLKSSFSRIAGTPWLQVFSSGKLDYSLPNELPLDNSAVTYLLARPNGPMGTLYVFPKRRAIYLVYLEHSKPTNSQPVPLLSGIARSLLDLINHDRWSGVIPLVYAVGIVALNHLKIYGNWKCSAADRVRFLVQN